MRVALVHDWLTGMRGGEKVLDALAELFPDARLFTLLHVKGSASAAIERMQPTTSFIQRLPFASRLYRYYLPFFPAAIEQFDLDGADLVISVSHCVAKSVVRRGGACHLCYCLTPMRYAWDQFDAYFGPSRVGPMGRRALRAALARLARWDERTSSRADRYVAISRYVAGRIRRYYNRDASVIHPPVDVAFYHPDASKPEPYGLMVSALVPYKRVDLAIEACRLAGVPLKIAGDGPERGALERMAGRDVEFLGWRSDVEIRDLYRRAQVVLLPGEEDFGLVPVEAQACGRPVVALGRGGARETVIDGETGVLVDEPTPRAFADGLRRAAALRFDSVRIRRQAEGFSRERFVREMRAAIADLTSAREAHQP